MALPRWRPCWRAPPPGVRLALATRADPPLPLAGCGCGASWWSCAPPTCASPPPRRSFPGLHPPGAAGARRRSRALVARTEGWAVGLRLAAIAIQVQGLSADELRRAPGAGRQLPGLMDYLLEEVFQRQPAVLQYFLLRTAVAERLCGVLLATRCWRAAPTSRPRSAAAEEAGARPRGRARPGGRAGSQPLPHTPRGVPCAAGRGRPPRRRPGRRRPLVPLPPAAARPLALPAAGAVGARRGGGPARPRRGLVRRRGDGRGGPPPPPGRRRRRRGGGAGGAPLRALLEEDLPALERWLNLLPSAVVAAAGRRCWWRAPGWRSAAGGTTRSRRCWRPRRPRSTIRQPAAPRAGGAGWCRRRVRPDRAALAGEIAVLTEWRCFVEGDAPGALAAAERALALLPEAYAHARGGAIGIAAPAALATGGADAVLQRLEALPGAPTGSADTVAASALPGVGVALILAGRHQEAAGAGRALLELGRTPGLSNARCWGHVLLGTVQYEWDDLEAAAQHLQAALEERDRVRLMALRVSTFGLALVLQAQGRPGEADGVLDQLSDALLRTANVGELARVGSFRVRLALLRGELAPARRWLPAAGGLPPHWLDTVLDSPPLTRAWARLRLAPEAPAPAAALAAALAEVDALLAETERLHLVTRQAQALALRALAQHALGRGRARARVAGAGARSGRARRPGAHLRRPGPAAGRPAAPPGGPAARLGLPPAGARRLRAGGAPRPGRRAAAPPAPRRRPTPWRSRWWSRSRAGSWRCSTASAGSGSTRRSRPTSTSPRRRSSPTRRTSTPSWAWATAGGPCAGPPSWASCRSPERRRRVASRPGRGLDSLLHPRPIRHLFPRGGGCVSPPIGGRWRWICCRRSGKQETSVASPGEVTR